MITCSCGKVLDKVPSWLESVQIEFICNNCPNRQIKSITEVKLAPVITETAELAPAEPEISEDEADEDK